MKVVACYVRVSTVGQNEAGQRAEVEHWLTGNGIDPGTVRWFVDKGKSGDSLISATRRTAIIAELPVIGVCFECLLAME